ncbi:YlxR family protein [Parasphingorhabdus pacifica]
MARREGARIRTHPPGDRDASPGPVRTCVGCRTRTSAAELLRVVARDGETHRVAIPDPRRRQPGRGAWLHSDPACLRLAERRRAFPRALRVQSPLDLSALQDHLTGTGEHAAHDVTDAGTSRARQLKEAGRPVMNQP